MRFWASPGHDSRMMNGSTRARLEENVQKKGWVKPSPFLSLIIKRLNRSMAHQSWFSHQLRNCPLRPLRPLRRLLQPLHVHRHLSV